MTPCEIARLRLAYQHISAPGSTAAEVVASLVAMQAQDYLASLWSVGLRTVNASEATVTKAIADRAIVRTWPMRGTLHWVAAEDVRWLLKLLTPRIITSAAGRHRKLELDEAVFARSRKLFIKALKGGNTLSRDDMYQVLERGGISTAEQRGYHTLWRLAQEGLICFASHIGKQAAFALLDEWVPGGPVLSHEEALGTLALRYFNNHGPATLADFVWWSGLKISDARTGLELAKHGLVREPSGAQEYWMGSNAAPISKAKQELHLLPSFDEYLLGYTDRSAVLHPDHAASIIAGGIFHPSILVRGQVAGTWRRTLRGKTVSMAWGPFSNFSVSLAARLEAKGTEYRRFLADLACQ